MNATVASNGVKAKSGRAVVHSGFVPMRCPNCKTLLCCGAPGSVVEILCRKCDVIVVECLTGTAKALP